MKSTKGRRRGGPGVGIVVLLLVDVAFGLEEGKKSWNFDKEAPGGLPAGFTREVGEWKTVADETAPSRGQVLAQTAKSSGPTFNVALVKESGYQDLQLSVRMKAIAGETDQGGGLVWRARDKGNYYIVRYNPLEENFRVYKVVDGKRTQLGSADIDSPPGWHEIRVTMKGEHIECYLDDKKLLDVKDATFKDSGKIGLWTKADAQTHFDDLTVTPPGTGGEVGGLDTVHLKALRKVEINVVAIHHHMTHEEPRTLFLHYWGKGPAATLAQGVRSALDAQTQAARATRTR